MNILAARENHEGVAVRDESGYIDGYSTRMGHSKPVPIETSVLFFDDYGIDDIHTLSSKSIAAARVGEQVPEIFPKGFFLVFVSGSAQYVVIQMRSLIIYYIYIRTINYVTCDEQ